MNIDVDIDIKIDLYEDIDKHIMYGHRKKSGQRKTDRDVDVDKKN